MVSPVLRQALYACSPGLAATGNRKSLQLALLLLPAHALPAVGSALTACTCKPTHRGGPRKLLTCNGLPWTPPRPTTLRDMPAWLNKVGQGVPTGCQVTHSAWLARSYDKPM